MRGIRHGVAVSMDPKQPTHWFLVAFLQGKHIVLGFHRPACEPAPFFDYTAAGAHKELDGDIW